MTDEKKQTVREYADFEARAYCGRWGEDNAEPREDLKELLANTHKRGLEDACEVYEPMRKAVVRFMVAQGPHMPASWKEFLVKELKLEIDKGNPYQHPVHKPLDLKST